MLTGLQEEIDLHPELSGVSKSLIISALNAEGSASVETWITNTEEVLYSLNQIYTYYVSDSTLGNLLTLLELTEYATLKARLIVATNLDMSSAFVIAMLGQLLLGEVCTQTEYDTLIALGQVKQSRAEELFSRKITMEDFE